MTTGEKLKSQLTELSRNLWWAWNPHIIKLFRDLDPDGFRAANHNPVSVLAGFSLERFEDLAKDAVLRTRVDSAFRELRDYLGAARTWGSVHAGPLRVRPVAYFSAEFGIHESLPIYSGGLGVLAGDHLKSASDLGLPLVAVGLFYRESYFRQRIGRDGWQHAEYVRSPVEMLPAQPALTPAGQPIVIEVPLSRETLRAQVWEIAVGRNKLFLLDTDVDGNSEENRQLAARLYFGDQRIRIRQELLLGVGGVRALRAAGIHWGGLHLNEGHSAFATLEYTRLLMELTGADFRTCAQEVAQSTVFTTHTPVDAGHDRFPPELVDDHLEPLRRSLGLAQHEFLGLGRIRPEDHREALCMTVLAFKMSRYANGVSALHGRVTRKSWQVLWPHHREDEVPVGHITNGVHVRTWLAPAMQDLYAKYMGADWREHLADPRMWAHVDNVPDAELWETHRVMKAALVRFVRRRITDQRRRNEYSEDLIASANDALDPEALTIGFARRFATYKRASLLFHDIAAPQADPDQRDAPGADRVLGQGSPGGPSRPGGAAPGARIGVRRRPEEPRRVRRGLRHQRRPPPGPGRRRVAEQPAPPARGQRDQRPEGASERRPQLLGAGRLVGGGLRRAERLRDRRRHHARQHRGAGPARRRLALRHDREPDRSGLLRT